MKLIISAAKCLYNVQISLVIKYTIYSVQKVFKLLVLTLLICASITVFNLLLLLFCLVEYTVYKYLFSIFRAVLNQKELFILS